MKIKKIDFGKIDANNELQEMGDEKYLASFFDYEKYHILDFISGKRYYICGNKGTGKTALLKYLEVFFRKNPENLIIPIRFKTDIDELDRNRLRAGSLTESSDNTEIDLKNARTEKAYTGIWQVFLLHKILEASKRGEFEVFDHTREFTVLEKLVFSIYSSSRYDIIPKIKRGNIKLDVSILEAIKAEIGVDLEYAERTGSIKLSDTAKAIGILYEQLKWARTPVYVLIDELELSVENSKARKKDIGLVRDLILSVNRLNEISKKNGFKIYFIASIREDVMNDIRIAGYEINKCIEDYGVTIDWLYKGGNLLDSPLLSIIDRKIRASENDNGEKPVDDIWKTYFPSRINDDEFRSYLLGYSWQKPRDIIRMLRLAQEEATIDDDCFTQVMFDRALRKYSERSWNEICEELILYYSADQLKLIKKLFTGIAVPFTYADIQNKIIKLQDIYSDGSADFLASSKNLLTFLEIMFKWGVIGNTGKRTIFSFLGYTDLDITGKMIVHRPLRNFFGVFVPDRTNNQ